MMYKNFKLCILTVFIFAHISASEDVAECRQHYQEHLERHVDEDGGMSRRYLQDLDKVPGDVRCDFYRMAIASRLYENSKAQLKDLKDQLHDPHVAKNARQTQRLKLLQAREQNKFKLYSDQMHNYKHDPEKQDLLKYIDVFETI